MIAARQRENPGMKANGMTYKEDMILFIPLTGFHDVQNRSLLYSRRSVHRFQS